MKHPNIWNLGALVNGLNDVQACIGGKYYPARPIGYQSLRSRLRATWLVFTGRADAVIWPGGQ